MLLWALLRFSSSQWAVLGCLAERLKKGKQLEEEKQLEEQRLKEEMKLKEQTVEAERKREKRHGFLMLF